MIFTPKQGMKVVGLILLVYAVLVASHEGEFWPFSIYPMFSQAGNPWTRAMVVDVTDVPDQDIWETQTLKGLQGKAIAVKKYGVDQIDFSNYVSKTDNWTSGRKQALKRMFGEENLRGQRWMASRVHGKLAGQDSVVVRVVPFLLITEDSVYTNPQQDESFYYTGGTK